MNTSHKLSTETMASKRPITSGNSKECRICLETQQDTPEKIMINPCECTGSVKFVHD